MLHCVLVVAIVGLHVPSFAVGSVCTICACRDVCSQAVLVDLVVGHGKLRDTVGRTWEAAYLGPPKMAGGPKNRKARLWTEMSFS